MPKAKFPDSKSPSEEEELEEVEEEEEDYNTAKAKHLIKAYKCYNCGKTEIGKNLDDLYENNRDESWYFEFAIGFDVYPDISRLPLPQPSVRLSRAYCNTCGKIRERELELFRIEHRKMKALEGISSALESIAASMPSMSKVASALESVATAISISSP